MFASRRLFSCYALIALCVFSPSHVSDLNAVTLILIYTREFFGGKENDSITIFFFFFWWQEETKQREGNCWADQASRWPFAPKGAQSRIE